MTKETYKPSKFLFAAVIGMGLLIIIGTTLLLTLIFQRMTHHRKEAQILPIAFVQKNLPLTHNEHIRQITSFGDHSLALLISDGSFEHIIIWDPFTNQVTARLDMSHDNPS